MIQHMMLQVHKRYKRVSLAYWEMVARQHDDVSLVHELNFIIKEMCELSDSSKLH